MGIRRRACGDLRATLLAVCRPRLGKQGLGFGESGSGTSEGVQRVNGAVNVS